MKKTLQSLMLLVGLAVATLAMADVTGTIDSKGTFTVKGLSAPSTAPAVVKFPKSIALSDSDRKVMQRSVDGTNQVGAKLDSLGHTLNLIEENQRVIYDGHAPMLKFFKNLNDWGWLLLLLGFLLLIIGIIALVNLASNPRTVELKVDDKRRVDEPVPTAPSREPLPAAAGPSPTVVAAVTPVPAPTPDDFKPGRWVVIKPLGGSIGRINAPAGPDGRIEVVSANGSLKSYWRLNELELLADDQAPPVPGGTVNHRFSTDNDGAIVIRIPDSVKNFRFEMARKDGATIAKTTSPSASPETPARASDRDRGKRSNRRR